MTPRQLLAHTDSGQPWPAEAPRPADMAAAYRDALAVRALREARGERPMGFKIGFTNRTIWDRYGVFAPIWGMVWDTTLRHCPDGRATLALDGLCQPRLEPELVFGLRAAPPAGATLEQLFDSLDWLATGVEVVQSHAPGWRFTAPETVADGGLHARLLVGPTQPVRAWAGRGAALDERPAACRVRLSRDGLPVEQGQGANVLDGPLHALLHFVHELQRCPGAPALRPGDVVTTGTWTDAWPLAPGQRWQADFDAPLADFDLETV
ncbi:MAG: hydratase [Piscinibacter sp.]|uniref:2-keto-4-pentenoate hydratase n=1 Tax=Piscinibacter sp. TaxID=1903157 RepID=UPI00258E393B|nr:hydratase [Piscinibacter sp.]MCW5666948.1 hydratase [Piscinibacter sp.]